jgi:hypothetical protein
MVGLDVWRQTPPGLQRPAESARGGSERGARVRVVHRPAHQRRRGRERGRWRTPTPREPHIVAKDQPPAPSRVPVTGRMVVHDHLILIDGAPPGRGEVGGQERLFAAQEQPRFEAAHREDGVAPYHRRSGQESHQTGRAAAGVTERAACHDATRRIRALGDTDEDSPADDRDVRMRGQHGGGAVESVRRPPRVVVGERDERCPRGPQADVAAGGAEIPMRGDDDHTGERVRNSGLRAIARAVVDDDHRHARLERTHACEGALHVVGTIVGEHDDRGAGMHRRGHVRELCHRAVYPHANSLVPVKSEK